MIVTLGRQEAAPLRFGRTYLYDVASVFNPLPLILSSYSFPSVLG